MDQEEKNNNGIDLSKSFDEDRKFQKEKQSPEYFFRPGTPKMIQWVIKYSGGLIKNEKQATYVLLGFIAFAITISFYLVLSRVGTPETIEGTEYHSYEGYGGQELPDEYR